MDTGEKLVTWYMENKRDLPWRRTHEPYAIWVSEIMLQQTRVDTVTAYYKRFLERFPDVNTLANTEENALLQAWEGLGYYSRARNMQKAAKIITDEYNGIYPSDIETVRKLPGIGPYTAGAIMSIAYDQAYPAVDGNVLRVLSRITGSEADISLPVTKEKVGVIALNMMPEGRAGDFNQALMELGATICTPQTPHCDECPVQKNCMAHATGRTDTIPVKNKDKGPLPVEKYWAFIFIHNQNIWMQYRGEEKLLGRMWGLPLMEKGDETIQNAVKARFGVTITEYESLGVVRHIFTHKIWEMEAVRIKLDEPFEAGDGRWVMLNKLSDIPIPTAFQKVLKKAGYR